ncbi:hypothetical protein BDC45DRAFT_516044 [Circinella umbellata]|nr:hypothetical protein BDC45DRAFT_516044 [Circinella umbellata]
MEEVCAFFSELDVKQCVLIMQRNSLLLSSLPWQRCSFTFKSSLPFIFIHTSLYYT